MTKGALSSLDVCDTLTRPSNLTSGLGSLAPQLHHEKHESIARNAEQRRDAHIPPPVVPLVDVHRP